jgi:uroporphyrinogen decarboxylase
MTKIERVRAALTGNPADRAPFSVWYHFGTQHAPPERTAQIHLEFFEYYDLDFLKVMNDYEYPMPDGLDVIESREDLKRVEPFDVTKTSMGRQLRAIETIAKALRSRALFVDTLFNAWNTMRRSLAREALEKLMADEEDALSEAIGAVNENLIRYARASLERGAAGIFFSVPATEESLTLPQYEKFVRPFDLAFLDAVQGAGEMHILHAHGEKLYLDRLLDYPAHVLSWADLNGGPSISDMRPRTSCTLAAGLDHVRFPNLSAATIQRQVKTALAQGGKTKFILAPGCSIPTYSFPALIQAARDAARSGV